MTPPITVWHNYADDAVLYPTHVLSNPDGDDVAGSEVYTLADNLRDLTHWTTTTTNTERKAQLDCGVAKPADITVLDRGHNLAGKTVYIEASPDNWGSTPLSFACVIPTTPGGLAWEANGCLTPEGVWWKTWGTNTYRYWRIRIPALGIGIAPLVTGWYLGKSYSFPDYLFGPAAYDFRTRVQALKNEISWGGVRVRRRILNFSEIALNTLFEDDTEFLPFNDQIQFLLQYGQPVWFCLDPDSAADTGRMRLYQLGGDVTYDPVADPIARSVQITLEEVIPLLRI